jgi:hypothetical protein
LPISKHTLSLEKKSESERGGIQWVFSLFTVTSWARYRSKLWLAALVVQA